MATNTYTALLTTTVGTATPTVSISPIPSGYTDLVVVGSIRSSSSTSVMRYRYNGATTNYSATTMYGVGSGSGGSFRTTGETGIYGVGGSGIYVTNTADTFTTFNLHIFNYANTTTYKTSIVRTGGAASADATVGLWRATPAAITQLDFVLDSGNFAVGSTFTIYGIAAASVGAKATGGIISSDSQYYYHTFIGNGTFTPTQNITCDYVLVAGGGGGGAGSGGGGGAGGYRYLSNQSLTSSTNYSITVGGGGTKSVYGSTAATSGVNSSFASTSATGGGRSSGDNPAVSPSSGGSGGGGYYGAAAGSGNAGSYSPVEGYAGGAGRVGGAAGNPYSSGGGGGASQVGAAGTVTGSGKGGDGVTSTINGYSVTYAGGGGGGGDLDRLANSGGAGGAGGGGAGGTVSTSSVGADGTPNTGGGGGGGANAASGGNGGSGIVIVRYAK